MMKACHRRSTTVAAMAAAASASVSVAILSYHPFGGDPLTERQHTAGDGTHARGESTKTLAAAAIKNTIVWHQRFQKSYLSSWRQDPSPRFVSPTKCEVIPILNGEATNTLATVNDNSKGFQKSDFYYVRINPNEIERTSLLDSHAVFGALFGEGLIERYNVYRRVNPEKKQQHQSPSKRELTVVDLKLGSRLNGHGGIVHGGIISLLFDEAMGWAYECLQEDPSPTTATTAVTANLTVDFRIPLLEGSDAVVRVYHDESKGRKIYFSATLESMDGSVVFAEAKSLFILVRSDRLNSNEAK